MLIEFSVANYRSFRERQTFSFAATSSSELKENNTFTLETTGLPDLVTSAAVFGANASGKSNLVWAMHFMRKFVLNSSKGSQLGDLVDVDPFRFGNESLTDPSEFEVVAVHKGVRYQYGFSVNQKRVFEEWLFAFPEGRSQKWFERTSNDSTKPHDWFFGQKFKGEKEQWRKATRENALFLSTAVQLNSDSLKDLFFWFEEAFTVLPSAARFSPAYTIEFSTNKERKDKILEFLNAADLSLLDFEVKSEKFPIDELPENISDDLKKDLVNREMLRVFFVHGSPDSSLSATMEGFEESRGTQKLFELAGPVFDILEKGTTLVVDELDNSFHIHIVLFLIRLFQNPEINRNHAQLLFTTHNTALMDPTLFRRDQIWFLEKDKNFASKLFPLTDFSPRKGELFRKNYLGGRYGAIPLIKDFAF